ncbi:MAG: polysaccharide biosynthesis/export family protein [Hyphomicrobiaceae bacterium]|nr:polysaccharide export protein [Hyphomicrobiaceae bacterium]
MLSRVFITLFVVSLAGCSAFGPAEEPQHLGFQTTINIEAPFATPAGLANPNVQVAGWTATVNDHRHPIVIEEFAADSPGIYRLDTGDRLRVFVYAQPSLSRIYNVDQEGFISVPLIGQVKARGQTTRGLEGTIRAHLATQYVRDPHVTVDIQQNRPFFILGEVRAAGQFPYISGMTVQSAVAVAGGFSDRANERKLQITRRINGIVEKLDVAQDTIVQPGDTIYVSERWF